MQLRLLCNLGRTIFRRKTKQNKQKKKAFSKLHSITFEVHIGLRPRCPLLNDLRPNCGLPTNLAELRSVFYKFLQ